MAVALTLGTTHLVPVIAKVSGESCSCDGAKRRCLPQFVFSISGQVRFRTALSHLASCRTRHCSGLRRDVLIGMQDKLAWLLNEEVPIGCVHVQPYLYGKQRVVLNRRSFAPVALHLSRCPKESCAQLRRALLLSVREAVRT